MRVRVIGGGWFGCHLTLGLVRSGHEVELHEISTHLFAGASGGNPARLHRGFHYPRSEKTRSACQAHTAEFMATYGHLTRAVPVNIYAIAEHDSLMDFGTYQHVLRPELEFITIDRPHEFGLRHVEGAVLTGERHIVIDEARAFFEANLDGRIKYETPPGDLDDARWDASIDCSGCALDATGVDRYEPCLTVLLEGDADRAVTIVDGPFSSVYPWNEAKRLSSLTSALYTPFSKTCRTWGDARALLDGLSGAEIRERIGLMFEQMCHYWPDVRYLYKHADERLTIRAMPRSGADARLVDVIRVGERALRVRAGKIDAIFSAERAIRGMIE